MLLKTNLRSFVSLSLDTELIKEIDKVRQDLPRSRFAERALRDYLEKLKHVEAVQTTQTEQAVDVY